MSTQRAKYFVLGLPVFVCWAAVFGSTIEARGQADPNLQSRIQTFSPPLAAQPLQLPEGSKADRISLLGGDNKCVSRNDPTVIHAVVLYHNRISPIHLDDDYFINHPELLVDEIRQQNMMYKIALKKKQYAERIGHRAIQELKPFALPPAAINTNCRVKQPTNVIVSFPFNPTFESNVLRSNTNIHSDTSLGFGGTLQVTTAGIEGRPFDIISFSASSASARYSAFPSRSLDTLSEQGAYQIFLDAFGYKNGARLDINPDTPNIPSTNLVTVDTLLLGYQNQTAFMPGFRAETADLFTPQVTLSRQNIALFGSDLCDPTMPNLSYCSASSSKQFGFRYFADLSLTVGQTLSDVTTQQNTNVAVSVAPGWRINNSDWKLTFPAVATARNYTNVVGGREDLLLQVGPTLSYANSTPSRPGDPFVMFSLAVTYNQNYSTVAANAWRGFIIQPTLTVAVLPPIAPK
jgi:hypothetical protein